MPKGARVMIIEEWITNILVQGEFKIITHLLHLKKKGNKKQQKEHRKGGQVEDE